MHEFYRGCQDWYQRQNPRWLPSQVIRHARFSGNSTSDLEAKVTKIQAYLRFGICLKFLCCFVLESSHSQTLMCIAMLNSRLERIFLELILVSFVLGVTKCSLCEHYEPPWPKDCHQQKLGVSNGFVSKRSEADNSAVQLTRGSSRAKPPAGWILGPRFPAKPSRSQSESLWQAAHSSGCFHPWATGQSKHKKQHA